jgi:hypothetical protein
LAICPPKITIRRTHDRGSDRICITPNDSVASIEKVVVNIDEPVSIMPLAFHTKDKVYCDMYKLEIADKRFCDTVINYVHFYFLIGGYPVDKSAYLIAFLPRWKKQSELDRLVNELWETVEWLEIRQKINCVVFRHGPPVHGTDNLFHWQKQLEKNIKETRTLYITTLQMDGKIKHVPTSLVDKHLTVSSNNPFACFNVS